MLIHVDVVMYNREKNLQEKFLSAVKERISGNLTKTLMELLPLEKEAIYRRLRGDVAFTFNEMAIVSTHLSLSLDEIANIESPYRSEMYRLHIRDYSQIMEKDMIMSSNYHKSIKAAAEDPNSEFGMAANTLPLHFSLRHIPIYRVYWLKWMFQFNKSMKDELCYSNIVLPEIERKNARTYLDCVQLINYTYVIWDSFFFKSLINDMNFFYNIRMITRKEMEMLKQEMYRLLDTLEYFADNGRFETGNRVEMYVSKLAFDSTYFYYSSENMNISMNGAYCLGAFTSLEKSSGDIMKNWLQGLKKSSTLITGASQYEKMMFFEKQKALLEKEFFMDD